MTLLRTCVLSLSYMIDSGISFSPFLRVNFRFAAGRLRTNFATNSHRLFFRWKSFAGRLRVVCKSFAVSCKYPHVSSTSRLRINCALGVDRLVGHRNLLACRSRINFGSIADRVWRYQNLLACRSRFNPGVTAGRCTQACGMPCGTGSD